MFLILRLTKIYFCYIKPWDFGCLSITCHCSSVYSCYQVSHPTCPRFPILLLGPLPTCEYRVKVCSKGFFDVGLVYWSVSRSRSHWQALIYWFFLSANTKVFHWYNTFLVSTRNIPQENYNIKDQSLQFFVYSKPDL
jgi:hypothetical protein